MVKRLNDEDDCFCSSGKKYKECHGPMLSKYNWRALKTKDTIDDIQNISKEIKKFYENKIKTLEKKIFYAIDEKLESEGAPRHNIRNAALENGLHIVIFPNDEIKKAKDSIIAHEYTHILLQEEKFPTIFPKNLDITSFANQLNNLLQDPLIYHRLKTYFKSEDDFILNVKKFKEDIKKNGLPNKGLMKLLYALTCARTYLIQEALFSKKDVTGFRKFLEEKYPDYFDIVTDIVDIFNVNGYNTPSKQNLIIKELSKKYHINGFIRVITL